MISHGYKCCSGEQCGKWASWFFIYMYIDIYIYIEIYRKVHHEIVSVLFANRIYCITVYISSWKYWYSYFLYKKNTVFDIIKVVLQNNESMKSIPSMQSYQAPAGRKYILKFFLLKDTCTDNHEIKFACSSVSYINLLGTSAVTL